MKRLCFLAFIFLVSTTYAQEPLRLMFYNLYRFPHRPPYNREWLLKDIFTSYKPDLFMVCELVTENGADRILSRSLNSDSVGHYERAVFVPSTDTLDPLHQMVFFRSDKLKLIGQATWPTPGRAIDHYTFELGWRDPNPQGLPLLEVFVLHLKSSDGEPNRNLRSRAVEVLLRALEGVPSHHYVVIAGDFNFYGSEVEPAYSLLMNNELTIKMKDPLNAPGHWHDNETFSGIHTQATRTSAEGFGIGGAIGGLDDRFDFIFLSENLMEAHGDVYYEPDSYGAFGNNGNCFDQRVDNYDCDGPYPLDLRKLLHDMSDHLPVVLSLSVHRPLAGDGPEKNSKKGPMVAYPVPVEDRLCIRYPEMGLLTERAHVRIYDAIGHVVLDAPWPIGASELCLDMHDWADGCFIIKALDSSILIFKHDARR